MKSVAKDITPKNFKGNLYLFAGEEGYMLLPADDAVRQVLAYSTESSFPSGNLPPHVKALLQDYSDVVEYARQNNLPQHPSWKTFTAGTESQSKENGVAPMVTARWGQSYPYNTLCPLDSNWIYPYPQCVTGCVATAMAQVMYYHKCPTQTTVIPQYTWQNANVTLPSLAATTFEWNNMLRNYEKRENNQLAEHSKKD